MLLDPKSTAVTKDTSQEHMKEMVEKLNDIEIFLVRLDVALMSCQEYAKSIQDHAECWRKVGSGEEEISDAEQQNRVFRFNIQSGFVWSQFIHFRDVVDSVPIEHLSQPARYWAGLGSSHDMLSPLRKLCMLAKLELTSSLLNHGHDFE